MASLQFYNESAHDVLAGTIDWSSVKFMGLDNTATFTATHTTLNQVAGVGHTKEVSGHGWAAGGELVTISFETYDTNSARILGADITKLASGGSIGSFYAGVLYDDAHADDKPIAFVTLDTAIIANEGTNMLIDFPAEGIFFITPA